jgi:hypothetical protein
MLSEVQYALLTLAVRRQLYSIITTIVFKLTNDNMLLLFCVSQPPDTFEKVANCVNYKCVN